MFLKNLKNLECTPIFHICIKNILNKRNVTFTHGSKSGGMVICIVIHISKNNFRKYLHLFKTIYELFYIYIKVPRAENVSNILLRVNEENEVPIRRSHIWVATMTTALKPLLFDSLL